VPGLALDHARQRFEEAHIVGDGGVEDDVGRVDIRGRRWVRRGGQRIERDPLQVIGQREVEHGGCGFQARRESDVIRARRRIAGRMIVCDQQ
jgi:hypothetical protein